VEKIAKIRRTDVKIEQNGASMEVMVKERKKGKDQDRSYTLNKNEDAYLDPVRHMRELLKRIAKTTAGMKRPVVWRRVSGRAIKRDDLRRQVLTEIRAVNAYLQGNRDGESELSEAERLQKASKKLNKL
jgi:hypothetical protein